MCVYVSFRYSSPFSPYKLCVYSTRIVQVAVMTFLRTRNKDRYIDNETIYTSRYYLILLWNGPQHNLPTASSTNYIWRNNNYDHEMRLIVQSMNHM